MVFHSTKLFNFLTYHPVLPNMKLSIKSRGKYKLQSHGERDKRCNSSSCRRTTMYECMGQWLVTLLQLKAFLTNTALGHNSSLLLPPVKQHLLQQAHRRDKRLKSCLQAMQYQIKYEGERLRLFIRDYRILVSQYLAGYHSLCTPISRVQTKQWRTKPRIHYKASTAQQSPPFLSHCSQNTWNENVWLCTITGKNKIYLLIHRMPRPVAWKDSAHSLTFMDREPQTRSKQGAMALCSALSPAPVQSGHTAH